MAERAPGWTGGTGGKGEKTREGKGQIWCGEGKEGVENVPSSSRAA